MYYIYRLGEYLRQNNKPMGIVPQVLDPSCEIKQAAAFSSPKKYTKWLWLSTDTYAHNTLI